MESIDLEETKESVRFKDFFSTIRLFLQPSNK